VRRLFLLLPLLLVGLVLLTGCKRIFPPKPSVKLMKHAFEAKEGTVFDTGTGLTITVPRRRSKGR